MSPEQYKAMVLKAKDYITAGDIFQVVLSQRFETEFTLPPFALYRSLRRVNPSPFLYYLDFDSFAVIGSSPEILVRVRDGKVTIRPIAGTRLIREWQGVEHCVTVRDNDFEYQGRPYKYLSAVARAITGTRWNGLIFFGLKNRRAPS